jgi:cyclic pyranopterin phosphate synthase
MEVIVTKATAEFPVEEFQDYSDLITQSQELVPDIIVDDTIRVKVLDRCGMTCTFCHNEGTPVAANSGFQALRVSIYSDRNQIPFVQGDITGEDEAEFKDVLVALNEGGYAQELHWTGGEPTLSKHLPELTEAAVEAGYSIKMTSNGQSGERGLGRLAAAGLAGVNFSVFGTTPEEFAATQAKVFQTNLKLAEMRLAKMDEAMAAACELGLRVKANIVITGSDDIDRGLRLLDKAPEMVKVRFQADTSNRQPSLLAIYELMRQLDAKPVSREIVAGCSIDNYDYELPGGRLVTFKQARFSRLPGTCDNCAVDEAGECHEGYYGLRLYKDAENTFWIGACLQRMETSETVEHFLAADGIGRAVQEYRLADAQKIKETYGVE